MEEYRYWLEKIKILSVRENAGQKIIKTLTGRKAEILIDPTMLIPVEKWKQLCKEPEEGLPEHYIVCYFLGRIDKEYYDKIVKFSKSKLLPVVMLFDITTPEYYTFDPAEVLYTIQHAEYVLTDSFHGTVFSILFHKNFYVFTRNEGNINMNSRIETLLEKFELEDRVFNEENKIVSLKQWEKIDYILREEKEKVKKYLYEALKIK